MGTGSLESRRTRPDAGKSIPAARPMTPTATTTPGADAMPSTRHANASTPQCPTPGSPPCRAEPSRNDATLARFPHGHPSNRVRKAGSLRPRPEQIRARDRSQPPPTTRDVPPRDRRHQIAVHLESSAPTCSRDASDSTRPEHSTPSEAGCFPGTSTPAPCRETNRDNRTSTCGRCRKGTVRRGPVA